MNKIINPNFSLGDDNIFLLRQKEYNKIFEELPLILKPVEDIGFQVIDYSLNKTKRNTFELNETLRDNLSIILEKDNNIIDLSFYVPSLVDGQYFIINGARKVPLFQLYDTPMIKRNDSIKMKTNIMTISLSEKDELPYIRLNMMKKSIPLSLLFFATYGLEEMEKKFDLKNIQIDGLASETLYDKFLLDVVSYYESSQDYTRDNFVEELGRLDVIKSGENPLQKGEGTLYSLDLILRCDVATKKFFKTDSIIEEFLHFLRNDSYTTDIDMVNRRLRLSEYLVLSSFSKTIFDFCSSNKDVKKPKYNINSQRLLSDINVSDIVQFDFSINPIDELTKLTRTTLLGPGGFTRDNVPEYLRDMDDSMFGRICVVDTPDRENCGVLQCVLPNVELDENLKFTENRQDKQPISIAVSMVPFLENNDQTRLQMAASQMRQAIMLKEFEVPLVRSGCESLYTDKTQFVKIAKEKGEVIHEDNKFMIVRYDSGGYDIFNVSYRNIFVGNVDFCRTSLVVGDKFEKGDILAESNFCKDGEIIFGRNLLTAVMPYYGYNYEDGMVISNELVTKKIFTSMHYEDLSFVLSPNKVLLTLDGNEYKPLPNLHEKLKQNEPYAVIREIFNEQDFNCIFSENIELRTKKETVIIDCNIYANSWNKEIPEFNNWIEEKIQSQKDKERSVLKKLAIYFSKDEFKRIVREQGLNKFSDVGQYKIKGEPINGIHFEISSVFQRPITLGDKLGSRHGGKGVVAKIVPVEEMPRLKDGRPVEIIVNPLSIISRMNLGQLFELSTTTTLLKEKDILRDMIKEGRTQEEIKEHLIKYITIMDNTRDGWYSKQFISFLPEVIDSSFIDELTIIEPPFECTSYEKLMEAKQFTDCEYTQEVYDPRIKQVLSNEVTVGYMYFFRMSHIADEKIAARGIGPYTKRTLQPLKGKKHKGGQRLGEMEVACLISHDAKENLNECLTVKSDSIDLKNRWLKEQINPNSVDLNEEVDESVEATRLLKSYFKTIGVDIDE